MLRIYVENPRIIEAPYMTTRVPRLTERFAKRLIKKPWVKPTMIVVPDQNIYQTPQGLICHPSIARELRAQIRQMQNYTQVNNEEAGSV